MTTAILPLKPTMSKYETLFHRHHANPILSGKDWPYSMNSVFNAGATLLADGSTLLLCRVEDRRGLSHLCAARSANGVDGWQIDREPTLLPRRINGFWALIHRPMTPLGAHVWISYSPDLRHWGSHKLMLEARRGAWWDANKIGMSPPPIETSRGWLMIYHGVRRTPSSSIYRLGLALFDLQEPEKCLVRGDSWMFAPEADCERHGDVQDVVFPCGYTVASDGDTTVPPIRALRWLRAAFAAFWLGWMPTAIPSILTTAGYASDHLVLLPAHFSLGTRESIWCTWPDTENHHVD